MKKNPTLRKSYQKVIKVIKSCKLQNQLEGASRMIKNFKTLYKNVGYPKTLSYNLDRELNKTYFRVTKQYPLNK